MFSFLRNLFGKSEVQSMEELFQWVKKSSIEEKEQYIKDNCPEMANWLNNHADMDYKKTQEIIILTVKNHVLRNYLIPFMKNHLSSDNIDEQLLQVERLKVTAANNIDWQLSFDAADRRRI
jgi:hypothetical protein